MTEIDTRIEVGMILAIETGSYSDKEFHGPVRVLKGFTLREVGEALCVDYARENGWADYGPSDSDLLPFMVANGYVEDIGNALTFHAEDALMVPSLTNVGRRTYEHLFRVMAPKTPGEPVIRTLVPR